MIRIASIMNALDIANEIHADAVVSIVDPDIKVPDFGNRQHLIVNFADTEVFTDLFAPRMFDIESIFDFVMKRDFPLRTVVHCQGGISRSVGIGLGLHVARGDSIEEAVKLVHKDRPNMSPNRLVLGLIERHLGIKNFKRDVLDTVSRLPQDLVLYCHICKTHFTDGDNCIGGHW